MESKMEINAYHSFPTPLQWPSSWGVQLYYVDVSYSWNHIFNLDNSLVHLQQNHVMPMRSIIKTLRHIKSQLK